MTPLKHGQAVIVKAILVRIFSSPNKKIWKPIVLKNQKTGIYIGYRTLANGHIDYDYDAYDYDAPVWCPEEYFRAFLISTDERTKPIYVRPCDVEGIKNDIHGTTSTNAPDNNS